MTQMFKTMAIRTQHFEINPSIIVSVPVLMMDTKDVGIFVKSASLTFIYFTSFFHIGANCCKRWRSIFNFLLVATLNRAILFTGAFCSWIRSAACLTCPWFFGGYSPIDVITLIGAIFSNTNPRVEDRKSFSANDTNFLFFSSI